MLKQVEVVGCPACAFVPGGKERGPGCEQCEGEGWVYKVPNNLSAEEVRNQIAIIKSGEK